MHNDTIQQILEDEEADLQKIRDSRAQVLASLNAHDGAIKAKTETIDRLKGSLKGNGSPAETVLQTPGKNP
jgi:phage shock protein A